MDNETIQIALNFLQRLDLKGAEVEAFCKVRVALLEDAKANDDTFKENIVKDNELEAKKKVTPILPDKDKVIPEK